MNVVVPPYSAARPTCSGPGRDERRSVGLDPDVMQMHVRVDAARHDDVSRGIDDACGGLRQRAGSGDRRDGLAGDCDIAARRRPAASPLAAANDQIEHHRPVAERSSLSTGSDPRSPRISASREMNPPDCRLSASRSNPLRDTSGVRAHSPASR